MLTTQKDLIKQLNKLSVISPDPAFAARGRALFLASEKTRPMPILLVWSSVFAVILLLVVFSYGIFLKTAPVVSASFNSDKLSQEFNNLSINIELKEVSYRQNLNQAIASALTEISSNQAKHLNPDVLKSEEQNLDINSGTNPQIDQLLKTLIL